MKKEKGLKFDVGKDPLYLISTYAMSELAKVLEQGAIKYSPWNWSSGIKYSRVISAAKRHIAAWEERVDIDEETRTNHLANAMCNLMFLIDFQARKLDEFDDRRPTHSLKKKKK